MEKEFKELTEKQKIFCREYITTWNATKAALKAGYSENTAYSIGWENLKKPEIQEYIEHLKKNLAEVAEVSPLMILNEYKKIAFSSIAHLHNTWIEKKEFETLTDEQKECIQEIETKIERVVKREYSEEKGKFIGVPYNVEYVKIKLYDKLKGLQSINKMMGWDAPSKVDVSNEISYSNLSDSDLDKIIETLKNNNNEPRSEN